MNPLLAKVVCTLLAVSLSVAFGLLPEVFAAKWSMLHPTDPEYDKSKKRNICLAFLLNFGGGVLIANCFCHWLPEVREGIAHRNLDTALPLAEIIMCGGFFFICFLEEVIHHFLHPRIASRTSRGLLSHQVPPGQIRIFPANQPTPPPPPPPRKVSSQSHVSAATIAEEEAQEAAIEAAEDQHVMSAIRTFFVISALSFHSVIEGLALSLEEEVSGIWMNFGALAMHKFVIAFSVGVELISAQVTKLQYLTSIIVFSAAPAVGVVIGIVVMKSDSDLEGGTKMDDFVIQILQGIATGTILYVVFFEIFPKAKEVGGSGFQHVLAMTTGFGLFLPSLLFHVHKEATATFGSKLSTAIIGHQKQ